MKVQLTQLQDPYTQEKLAIELTLDIFGWVDLFLISLFT